MAQKEEKKLECIDNTGGEKTSEFLNGIEDFIKYQSQEINADLEHKAIFIVATDSKHVICSHFGMCRKNIIAIATAMKQDEDIATMIKSAPLLFSIMGTKIDYIIKNIMK